VRFRSDYFPLLGRVLHFPPVYTRYTHSLEKNTAGMAPENIGVGLLETGRADEAIAHLENLALRPTYAEGEKNLDDALNPLDARPKRFPIWKPPSACNRSTPKPPTF
jgi:hypothetical protein